MSNNYISQRYFINLLEAAINIKALYDDNFKKELDESEEAKDKSEKDKDKSEKDKDKSEKKDQLIRQLAKELLDNLSGGEELKIPDDLKFGVNSCSKDGYKLTIINITKGPMKLDCY